jgi:hypothetical protein
MEGLYGKFRALLNLAEHIAGDYGKVTDANMFNYDYATVKGVTGNGETFTITIDIKKGENENDTL